VASKYVNRAAIDDDTTIPDDPVVDGVTTGHDTHHPNAHSAIRILETYLGIVGTSPTTSPPGGGQIIVSTSAGQSDWAAPPVGTPSGTVVADTTFSRSSAVGVATAYSRGDHDHGAAGAIREVIFTFDTVTSPTTGTYKYRAKRTATLQSIRCALGTVAAAGLACQVNLLKNGSGVLSTKPSITVGQAINTNAPVFSSTALAADDLLSVNIDQGSDGAQLMVIVELQDNTP
jgi:hypothetical protein